MSVAAPTFSTAPGEALPTYHGRPAVKPSLYGWTVALYIYVGGLAAGLQILVTIADLVGLDGAPEVSMIGRAIALAGAIMGGILLIADLHTKRRFYNMLRIFRPTAPMSIGTYVLLGFGFWSLIALIGQAFGAYVLAIVCGVLASLTGWFMATYTAALLSATATPLWAAVPRSLAVRFASSALATGAAAACLIALGVAPDPGMAHAFGNFAALALFVQLIAAMLSWQAGRRTGVNGAFQETSWGPVYLIGVGVIGVIAPIVLFILANFLEGADVALAIIASICVLLGGFLMRGVVLLAGNESARRPRDYFRFAGGRGA